MQQPGHKSANESDNGHITQLKTKKTLGKPQSIKTSSPYQPIPSRTGQQPPIQSKQSKLGGPIPSKQGKLGPIKAKQRPIQRAEKGTTQSSSTETQLKQNVSQLMGVDVTDTQVHYNSDKPTQLKAEAYAQGNEVHLAPGKERHLGHELAHIGQQKQGRVKPTLQMKGGTSINDDPQLEQEADKIGDKALQMKLPQGGTLPLPQKSTPSGNKAPVQRVIITNKQTLDKEYYDQHKQELNPHIGLLMENKKRFFMIDFQTVMSLNDNKDDKTVEVLEDNIYIIGENHIKSSFDKKANPWTGIKEFTKASEGHDKHKNSQYELSPNEKAAIENSIVQAISDIMGVPRTLLDILQLTPYLTNDKLGWNPEILDNIEEYKKRPGNQEIDKMIQHSITLLDSAKESLPKLTLFCKNNQINGFSEISDKLKNLLATPKNVKNEELIQVQELLQQLMPYFTNILQKDQPEVYQKVLKKEVFEKLEPAQQIEKITAMREYHMQNNINSLSSPALVQVGQNHARSFKKKKTLAHHTLIFLDVNEYEKHVRGSTVLKRLRIYKLPETNKKQQNNQVTKNNGNNSNNNDTPKKRQSISNMGSLFG
ncbi:hypothetical protein M23134_02609 [Microscilla marina ATCC 23134]|uniref:eCIS core domain-containing protein n=2 Tax=Microscilla marina TaxID=1027 RepID=A1ZNQ1_MICM2|nr:hypothetical protein M23134_02609 [Microscilla marina ATCC 23134]